MKKMVSVILSVCLLLTLLPTTVFAADKTADAGAKIVEKSYDESTRILTVDMQIKLPDAVGITSVATMISYDSSKLTLLHKTKATEYIPTETRTDRGAAVNNLLSDANDDPYTVQDSMLYGKNNRAAFLVTLGTIKGPSDDQKTTDWLSIYSLRFKVSGPAATTLDSTSLRIADPKLENELVKYTYDNAHVNNYYTVAVVDGKTGLEYYFGKMQDNPEGELSGMKHLMAAEGNNTATYPGSDNAPSTSTTYKVSFNANGGTGTMADVTGVSGEYTLPANGFTAPAGKQFKAWSVGGVEKAAGDKITVTANTTVTAVWEPIPVTEYTITFNGNGGTPSAPYMTTVGKKLSSLPSASRSGSYSFDGWYTAASGGTQITTAYVFSANTTVYAHWTYTGGSVGVGSYTPSYTVSVDKTENGTITVSPKSASKGSIVTITVKPDKGYTLETLRALDMSGYAMELTENNGRFTFKMPASAVIVKATFMDDNTMLNFFVDVKASDYFYDAVLWAAEKGVTSGADALHFSPNAPCTRAQIVTFLWRAAGSPAPKHMSSFADVPADAFYAKAVAWAVENGITGGTGDGKFSPDATCTRAQAVTFLYRASGAPAVSGNAAFSDVATNAYYAAAVKWAEKNGITGGIGGGLFGSNNNCTRAQIVTFLYRSVK